MSKRLTIKEKWRVAELLGADDRPLNQIIELVKSNDSPEYNSETIRDRSKATAIDCGRRFSKVARMMATQK